MLTHTANHPSRYTARLAPELSLRELEVLALLGEGMTDLAIAGALSISRRTVGSHMRNIRRKLRVDNRTQAVVVAQRMDLIPSESSREGLDVAPGSAHWSYS